MVMSPVISSMTIWIVYPQNHICLWTLESVGVSPFQPSVPLDHSWNVARHLHLTQVILIPFVWAKEELKSCYTWTSEFQKTHVSGGIFSWICFLTSWCMDFIFIYFMDLLPRHYFQTSKNIALGICQCLPLLLMSKGWEANNLFVGMM